MISASSFLYTLVLFSGLSSRSVTVAMPAAKIEDEGLGLLLGDEPAVVPPVYRRMDVQGSSPRDGRSKIIVVSDLRLKGFHGESPAFLRSPHLLTDQNVPTEDGLTLERRNADLDILRCMVGRVYRPCWEVEV
ncbi:pro-MCH [Takifugu flavidus]|nr:pro-MCH [Takifugu flavidus]TWW64843.1 Pro-MCH 2 [Takifugu flavidus]